MYLINRASCNVAKFKEVCKLKKGAQMGPDLAPIITTFHKPS